MPMVLYTGYVPSGCTLRVQVVDVTFNKPFKDKVRRLFEDHLDKHLELYVEGKLSASQWRILKTKNVVLSVAFDGSENAQVSIDGIPNYELPQQFVEEEFKLLDDDEDEDEDASENDEKRRIWPFDWSADTISCWAVIIIWTNFTLKKKLKLLTWNCYFIITHPPPRYNKPIKKAFLIV